MDVIKIEAQEREANGKKGTRAVRAEGLIPAVIYGGDTTKNIAVTKRAVKPVVYTPDFNLAEIEVGGSAEKCIVKDIQFHPVTDEIVHIDFLRVIPNTPIKVEVPITFTGVSPGVKAGGKLIQSMRRVKIKTTPENMVDNLSVDIGTLELGDSVRVRDIASNSNIEIMIDGSVPIAIVEVPRALKSASAAAEKAAVPGEEPAEAPAE